MRYPSKLFIIIFSLLFLVVYESFGGIAKHAPDTNANDSRHCLRITLSDDSAGTEDMVLEFNEASRISFDIDEDTLFQPNGKEVNICSISPDNFLLSTNVL